MQSKVLLVYTGGTIGMNRNSHTGALEPLDFEHLLQFVPELKQFDMQIDIHQFNPPLDSSDMSPQLWTDLSHVIADNYDDYDGFVVLHGTDTMAYTASALSYMLENLTKPVIFTGSQLPIEQLRTDGKENLITSIEIAAAKDEEGHARVPEVGIYFNGSLLRGNRTTKQSADEFKAFESFNYMLMALVSVGFAACGDDDDEPKSADIVGTWSLDTDILGDYEVLFQFTKDGKFHEVHTSLMKCCMNI